MDHGCFHFNSRAPNETILQEKKKEKEESMYLQCTCSFKNILFSICVTSQTSPLSPVSHLTAWSENGGKVNLQSGSACETGLAQKNRAQSFSAQVQQCFPNLTFSALAFWCCSSGRHTV